MNTITKKITAIILVFALFCSLFVGIDLKSTAKGEEANGENAKIEWQMFLKERNHTNFANPMEIGIFDPVIEWDKSIDVISWGTTIGNFAANIEGEEYDKEISHVVFIYEAEEADENERDKVLCIADGANGETMWEWYFDSEDTKTTPALAYFDDDDKLDVVFGANNGTLMAIEPIIKFESNEYDITNESEYLWDYKTKGEFTESSPAIADLNDDGTQDIAIGVVKDEKCYLYTINGKNGKLLKKTAENKLKGNFISTPAIMGAPIEYVVVTTLDKENDKLYVYGYDSSIEEQTLQKEFVAEKGRFDYIIPSPTIEDLDDDGDLDIIVASTLDPNEDDDYGWVYAFDIIGDKPNDWSNKKIKGHIGASLAVGDGKIVVQSYYYKDWPDATTVLTVLDYKGKEIWKTEYDTDSGVYVDRAVASPILADLNDDGISDIISATTPNIVAYDGNSTSKNVKQLWALELDEDFHTLYDSPAAGDINGDNLLDLVIDSVMITTKIPDLYIEPRDIEFYVDDKLVIEEDGEYKVDEGDEVKIKVDVHNKGSENAENVIVRFFSDDKKIGQDQKIKEIIGGGKSFTKIMWDTAGEGGEHYIKVIADPDNKIKESDENNNKAQKKITVREPYKVKLICDNNETTTDPGNQTSYEIVVKNEGSKNDKIELTFSEPPNENWEIDLNEDSVELESGEFEIVTLSVKPSEDTLADEKAIIKVTGTSTEDDYHDVRCSDSIFTTTTVDQVYGVDLVFSYDGDVNLTDHDGIEYPYTDTLLNNEIINRKKVNPGNSVTYEIEVRNTGNAKDVIELQYSNLYDDWVVSFSGDRIFEIEAFQSKLAFIKITAPIDSDQMSADIPIIGKSKGSEDDDTKDDESDTIQTFTELSPIGCDKYVQMIYPDFEANYTIDITNTFDENKNINLNIEPNVWNAKLSNSSFSLESDEDKKIYLTLTVPSSIAPSTVENPTQKTITVNADFEGEGTDYYVKTTTVVKAYHDVILTNKTDTTFKKVDPGNSIEYVISVENNGTVEDTIDLDYRFIKNKKEIPPLPGWSVIFKEHTDIITEISEIPAGFEKEIKVVVTASEKALYGNQTVEIIGRSRGNASKFGTINLTVFVNRTYGVDLICINNKTAVDPGMSTNYNITVINTGNDEDTINLTIDETNSPIGLANDIFLKWDKLFGEKVKLKPFEETNITLQLTISENYSIAYSGAKAEIIVKGILLSNETITDKITTTTSVNQVYDITLSCGFNESKIFPGASEEYSIELKNNGNGLDSVDFKYVYLDEYGKESSTLSGWTVIINGKPELKNFEINRDKEEIITLKVIAPPINDTNAKEGFTAIVKLTAISNGIDINPVDNHIITETTVKQVYGVELIYQYPLKQIIPEKNVIPEEFVTYKIIVRNKGNGEDTFILELKNENEDWIAEIVEKDYQNSVTLDNYGEEQLIKIKVTAPKDISWGSYAEISISAKSENGTVDDENDDIYANITTKTIISQIMCEDNEHYTDPSEMTNYTIKLMNIGASNEVKFTFDLSKIQDGWNAELSEEYVYLNAWEKDFVTLSVTGPEKNHENAFAGNMFFINVTGSTPFAYGNRSDTILTITTINRIFDVELVPEESEKSVDISDLTEEYKEITFDISVWNRGNAENEIKVRCTKVDNNWDYNLIPMDKPINDDFDNPIFFLKSGEFAKVSLTLKVPSITSAGKYQTIIEASSEYDKRNKDTLILTTIVESFYRLNFEKEKEEINIKEGESKNFIFSLKNIGNSPDNITVTIEGTPTSWGAGSVFIDPSNFNLSEKLQYDFTLTISVPPNIKQNSILLNLIAESQNDKNVTDEMQVTVNIELLPNADIFIKSIEFSNDNPKPGDIVIITANIQNIGKKSADNFLVQFYLDDKEIYNTTISVNTSGIEEVKYEWQAVKGEHEIKVVLDSNNKITESDETNNEKSKTIIVGSKDDDSIAILPIFAVACVVVAIIGLFVMHSTGRLEELQERMKKTRARAIKEISEEKEEEEEKEETKEKAKKDKKTKKSSDSDKEEEEEEDSDEEEEEEEKEEKKGGVIIKTDDEFLETGVAVETEDTEIKEEIYTSCPECSAHIKVPKDEEFKCPVCKALIKLKKEEEKPTFPLITNCPSSTCNAKIKIKKAGKFECPKCKTTIIADENGNISEKKKVFPIITNCPSCEAKLKISRAGDLKCPKCDTEIEVDEKGNVSEKEFEEWDEVSIFPIVGNCPSCSSKIKISKPGSFKCPRCETPIEVDVEGKISEKKSVFPVITKCPSCQAKIKISKHGLLKCPKCNKKIDVSQEGKVELKKVELEEEEMEF